MHSPFHELRLPDLGLDATAITVSCWLVGAGQSVIVGDRLVEVLAGDVTVDLSAPATGRLVRRCVEEDDPVSPGQLLATIDTSM